MRGLVDWQLSVSVTKWRILHVGKSSKNFAFSINNVDLPSCSTVKDLNSLTSQSHINKVTATANQRVNLLMCAFVSRDQST